MTSIANPALWGGFAALVIVALLVDLVLMRHGGPHKVTFREALLWSLGWVVLALLFNAGLWWYLQDTAGQVVADRVALEFLTGYLIEKSLAVDNIFVFLMIFSFFAVPEEERQKVLIIGILAAIVLRAILIFAGAMLIAEFHWILYIFGAFLLLTGLRMFRESDTAEDISNNRLIGLLRRVLPVTRSYHQEHFFVRKLGRLWVTPLFLVLVMIELTDVVFAVDSIPAILGVTTDPFLAYASNIMAVVGLRALYFLLAGVIERIRYLHIGLGAVLVFIGVKMLTEDLLEWQGLEIPTWVSLLVVVGCISTAAAVSWAATQREKGAAPLPPPPGTPTPGGDGAAESAPPASVNARR